MVVYNFCAAEEMENQQIPHGSTLSRSLIPVDVLMCKLLVSFCSDEADCCS